MTLPRDRTSEPSRARREWSAVALFTLIAALLRFRSFGRLGLTHLDEGVYAYSGFWAVLPGGLGGINPEVIAFSPPGFPILVGLAYAAFGVSDAAALLIGGAIAGATALSAANEGDAAVARPRAHLTDALFGAALLVSGAGVYLWVSGKPVELRAAAAPTGLVATARLQW